MVRTVLVLLMLVGVAHADRLGFDPATVYKVPVGGSPAIGPADAPITIVAWSDFACGYCNRVQLTLDQLDRLYPGQIRWVHRTLPLDEDVTVTAEAALAAAAQGKFRPMSERIYGSLGRLDRAGVELIARELGLDMIRFRADLDTRAWRAQIAADVKDAAALGVTGTPTFFINGRPIYGNQPLKTFADVIDEELVRATRVPGGYDALIADGMAAANVPRPRIEPFELDGKQTYRVALGLPGHQLGPDTAPVTIVIWGDFQCPFCARMVPVLAELRRQFGDDVRIVYRHLAMRGHRDAALAAEAAMAAAAEGKFWAFHDRLFAGQAITRVDLEAHAEAVGLDVAKLRAALDDRRYRDIVAAETAAAEALGVDGTPTMFVNGTPVIGSRSSAEMVAIVAEHLRKARTAIAGGIPARDVYALFMSAGIGVDRSDPARIPTAVKVTLRPDDQARAVSSACRLHDRARANELAAELVGPARRTAWLVCAGEGIDLPVADQ